MLKTADLLDLSHSLAGAMLSKFDYPWQALDSIKALIMELGPQLGEGYTETAPQVWVHKTAQVAPTAYLMRIYQINRFPQELVKAQVLFYTCNSDCQVYRRMGMENNVLDYHQYKKVS